MHRLPPPDWERQPNWCPPNGFFVGSHRGGMGNRPAFLPGPYNMANSSHQAIGGPRSPFPVGYCVNQQQYPYHNNNNNNTKDSFRNDACQSRGTVPQQEFSCDVCERFFNTKQILETHLASHVQCDQDGCSFKASRKILKLHFIQNHAEGRMRIKLETPEEIEKWKEQRRKKFPTVANVQKKLAEQEAKREKGQVAETRTYRYRGNKQKMQNNNRRGKYRKHERDFSNQDRNPNHNNPRETEQQTNPQLLKESKGNERKKQEIEGDPLSLLLGDANSDSDNEATGTKQPLMTQKSESIPSATPDSTSSALVSLCASYGDISSDEENILDEIKSSILPEEPAVQIMDQNKSLNKTYTNKSPRERRKRKRNQGHSKNFIKPKKKATLLEKLLAPVIRHERNVVLQCIRYMVKNQFFDAPQESTRMLLSVD